MATLSLVIQTSKDPSTFKQASQDNANLSRILNLISGLNIGALSGTVDVYGSSADPVAATGVITPTQGNITNGDTITIGGVQLTAATSGNGTTSFTIGGNLAASCTNLAALINANTSLSPHITATATSTTVTLAAKVKGSIGNLIVMSTSDATAFAFTQFAGGTGGPLDAAVSIAR